jgi:hypothetical protein
MEYCHVTVKCCLGNKYLAVPEVIQNSDYFCFCKHQHTSKQTLRTCNLFCNVVVYLRQWVQIKGVNQWQVGNKMGCASSGGCHDYKTPAALPRIKFGPIISFGSNNFVHEKSIVTFPVCQYRQLFIIYTSFVVSL